MGDMGRGASREEHERVRPAIGFVRGDDTAETKRVVPDSRRTRMAEGRIFGVQVGPDRSLPEKTPVSTIGVGNICTGEYMGEYMKRWTLKVAHAKALRAAKGQERLGANDIFDNPK